MLRLFFPMLSIVVLCSQVFSAEPAVMNLMRSKYTTDSFIEAQFQMHIWWGVREREETKNGHLYIAPQNRFRVELGGETMVSDGKIYWQYSKKGAQVVIDNLSKLDLSYHPSQLLSTFLSKYSYRQEKVKDNQTVLNWTADDSSKGSLYADIVIDVITKTGEVTKLKVTDRNGNIQTFTFKKTVFGAKIPKEVFTFEVPDNIQVLDNR